MRIVEKNSKIFTMVCHQFGKSRFDYAHKLHKKFVKQQYIKYFLVNISRSLSITFSHCRVRRKNCKNPNICFLLRFSL